MFEEIGSQIFTVGVLYCTLLYNPDGIRFRHSATRSSDSSWLPGQKRPDVEPVMKKKSKPSKKKTTVVVEGPQPVQDFVDYGIRGIYHMASSA